jgi:C4-dicarboxylate-specific signal transduction histidine kinase
MQNKKTLFSIIYNSFMRASLIPIFVIEVTLLLLYFGINFYISQANLKTLLEEAKSNISELSKKEAKIIDNQLLEVSKSAVILQKEHEAFFKNPNGFSLPNGTPKFGVATNGVFYKTNKVGSSVYYSSKTKIGQKELQKATKTEFMDITFRSLVETNPNIVAVYFNSYDDMNRLYPFIDDVAKQYGEHIHMEDFNFYYLADGKHNPKKVPVWTGAYLDPAGNGWMASCVVPIYNGEILEGVTGIDMTIETFVKNILNLDLPWNSKAFLLDENGAVLAMPKEIEQIVGLDKVKKQGYTGQALTTTVDQTEEYNILKNKNANTQVKEMIEKNQKSGILTTNDKTYMLFQEIIPSTKWRFVIMVDEDTVLEPISKLKSLSNNIGYVAIILMVLFYIAFFVYLMKKSNNLAQNIASPILSLTEYIKNIGQEKTNNKNNFDAGIAEVDFIANFSTQIQRVNNEFYATNQKLAQMNQDLEIMVKNEVDKNRQKEGLLIQQSKMAAVGEMIASIVHQWKQPLNTISLASSSLQLKNVIGDVSKDEIDESVNVINNQIAHMSQTMTDFRNFFKPTQIKAYNAKQSILDSLKILNSTFIAQNIEVSVDIDDSIVCNGYPNETMQVFINILNNAKDAILANEANNKIVIVSGKKDGIFGVISVKDFAGGISEDIMQKIFEPYFSTKGENGTGIGLYMSKTIVEKVGGKFTVSNHAQGGANFEIWLPLADD